MAQENDNTVGTIGNIDYQPETYQESRCRICLEDCPEIYFCKCRGGLLSHRTCLQQFLKRRYERGKVLKCQICDEQYRLETTSHCFCSCQKAVLRFKQNTYRSIIAILTLFLLSLEVVLFIISVAMELLTDIGLKVVAAISVLCIIFLVVVSFKLIRDYFIDFTEEVTLQQREAPIKPEGNTTLEQHIMAISPLKIYENHQKTAASSVENQCPKQ